MNIETLVLGSMSVNSYLIYDNKEALIIDPGDEVEKILCRLDELDCKLEKILLTHGHFDHIGAVCELKEKTDAAIYIHSGDAQMLADNDANLSYMSGSKIKICTPDIMLDDIKTLDVGNSVIKVFYTPGHSRGGVSFLLEDNLFSGDLLFKESIGRFDFYHSNLWTELKSLRFLMENFDDSVKVYPGHGESTTIGYERENNPYIINHVLR